jgi:hypothetical protein
LTLREEQADGAGEQGVEENIWTQEEWSYWWLEKTA